MKTVTGKVAFVTGGASGIGFAVAKALCAAGMNVAIGDVEQAALDRAAGQLSGGNAEVEAIRVDVTSREQMAMAAEAVERRFGQVHVLVNNAGVAVSGPIEEMADADWDWVLGVNLTGVVNGLQAFLPRIRRHGEEGHIVNTASIAGHLAIPGLGVYCASKWAVVAISETLRTELAPHNVGVSVLCPAAVATNIFYSGRNRPEALSATGASSEPPLVADLEALTANAPAPETVADMVLHGILADEAYIFTHPEFKTAVSERFSGIQAAFDRWAAYRAEQPA